MNRWRKPPCPYQHRQNAKGAALNPDDYRNRERHNGGE